MIASVILLNWNGWKDTIECLESVFRLKQPDFRVVVCDNASNDSSLEKIKEWANGDLLAHCANQGLSQFVLPPVSKPVTYRELTREEAESATSYFEERLILIKNGGNLGFAGGCNVGLRYALGDSECQFFWLLNNDTVVEPDALSAMLRFMHHRPDLGLCGSLNVSYYNPTDVQAQGGKPYCRWTARVRTPRACTVNQLDLHPARMDFVNGASMLARRAFLRDVGLMEESYFLYFEELDWAMRAKGKFSLGYCPQSVMYHKEGATIGSNPNRKHRSVLSDMYLSRNRVLFTKRFYPWALPTVLISVYLAAAVRLCRGDVKRAAAMVTFMLRGLVAGA